MFDLGQIIKDDILVLARVLVKDSAPGWVGGAFLFALVLLTGVLFLSTYRRLDAIEALKQEIEKLPDREAFGSGFEELLAKVRPWRSRRGAQRLLAVAFDEYAQTIIFDPQTNTWRHAVRPSVFLNIEDVRFGPDWLRIIPGTFVSLGLLCTFLGLVAALSDLGSKLGNGSKPEDVIISLMTIASAKFVMSLVGLFCSIFFSVLLRVSQSQVSDHLHGLCSDLEARLSYVSLEDINFRQLEAIQEQRDFYKTMAFELVAELKRPLEAMPDQISRSITSSISAEIRPLFEQISRASSTGMESMVGDLSSQISASVGTALERASRSLTEASAQIGDLIARVSMSSDLMGTGMETALGQLAQSLVDLRANVQATGETAASTMSEGAERLLAVMNQTLEGIRDNTAAGADQMRLAAAEMRSAAEDFRQELANATDDGVKVASEGIATAGAAADLALNQASQTLLMSFASTSAEIARAGSDMSEVLNDKVLVNIATIGDRFAEIVRQISDSLTGLGLVSSGIRAGADKITTASLTFEGASRDLVAATGPVRTIQQSIDASIRNLLAASEATAQGSRTIAHDASYILEATRTALGHEREGIQQTMAATQAALRRLSEEAKQLDQIDEMLGKALSDYAGQLQTALGMSRDYIQQMSSELTRGVDTMRQVVEQAEQFMPASPRGLGR